MRFDLILTLSATAVGAFSVPSGSLWAGAPKHLLRLPRPQRDAVGEATARRCPHSPHLTCSRARACGQLLGLLAADMGTLRRAGSRRNKRSPSVACLVARVWRASSGNVYAPPLCPWRGGYNNVTHRFRTCVSRRSCIHLMVRRHGKGARSNGRWDHAASSFGRRHRGA